MSIKCLCRDDTHAEAVLVVEVCGAHAGEQLVAHVLQGAQGGDQLRLALRQTHKEGFPCNTNHTASTNCRPKRLNQCPKLVSIFK